MEDLEGILGLSVIAATIVLIARWRGRGILISIPFGYAAIYLLNASFPHDKWSDIEFAEDWPISGLIIMPLWSFLVYGVVRFCSWIRKEWRQEHA